VTLTDGDLLNSRKHDSFTVSHRFELPLTFRFWATVCKTVRPMLSDRCLPCPVCPVCDVGVLWPNRQMDQDETWHGGRPQPRPHCVRWGPSPPPQNGHSPPSNFRSMSIVATQRSPISVTAQLLLRSRSGRKDGQNDRSMT